MANDVRRAPRLVVNAPAVVESVGQVPMHLHPNLARVFRRFESDRTTIGTRFPAVIRDVSTNGAFIAGAPLPLMSRVALKFDVRGIGYVDAIGWVLWQRTDDCEVPTHEANTVLPKGFGVLFEAIPMDARNKIAALVQATLKPGGA